MTELTYSSYLSIETLTNLQQLQSTPDNRNELLFIITHQTYELWFKQIIAELEFIINSLSNNKLMLALKSLTRVNKILKIIVAQMDIISTLTPTEFGEFRGALGSSSGFQSAQFLEIEIMLGKKPARKIKQHFNDIDTYTKLNQRLENKNLWHTFIDYLLKHQTGLTASFKELTDVQTKTLLKRLYKNNCIESEFCETLLNLDEGLQEWRYRHLKLVERTIGAKIGTGGSAGAEHLKTSLLQPVFPLLWDARIT